MFIENSEWFLQNYKEVAGVIQEIHWELHTCVPRSFQAKRITEMLEERHRGRGEDGEILSSLQTERHHSTYFWEVEKNFRNLWDCGGLKMQLRKEWQGNT